MRRLKRLPPLLQWSRREKCDTPHNLSPITLVVFASGGPLAVGVWPRANCGALPDTDFEASASPAVLARHQENCPNDR